MFQIHCVQPVEGLADANERIENFRHLFASTRYRVARRCRVPLKTDVVPPLLEIGAVLLSTSLLFGRIIESALSCVSPLLGTDRVLRFAIVEPGRMAWPGDFETGIGPAKITTRRRLNPAWPQKKGQKSSGRVTRRCEGRLTSAITRKLADPGVEGCAVKVKKVSASRSKNSSDSGQLVLQGLTKAQDATDTKKVAPETTSGGKSAVAACCSRHQVPSRYRITVHFDGGCFPNPGSKYGSFEVLLDGLPIQPLCQQRIQLGHGTARTGFTRRRRGLQRASGCTRWQINVWNGCDPFIHFKSCGKSVMQMSQDLGTDSVAGL